MDGIDDTVVAEEPHFVSPGFGISLGVLGGVVVDEVEVFDVAVKGWVEGCAGVEGHGRLRAGAGMRFESRVVAELE